MTTRDRVTPGRTLDSDRETVGPAGPRPPMCCASCQARDFVLPDAAPAAAGRETDDWRLDAAAAGAPQDAFGFPTPSTTVGASGEAGADALLVGTKWTSATITYAATSSPDDYEFFYIYRREIVDPHEAFTGVQRAALTGWFETVCEGVSGLDAVELTGTAARDATIRVAETGGAGFVGAAAFAFYPDAFVYSGDIWFNRVNFDAPTIGSYAYYAFGHEIGHALGLKHGHEAGGVGGAMAAGIDSVEYSIMTYRSYVGHDLTALPFATNRSDSYAQSLMMYDIRAIQHMYGADFTTNAGDSVYTFSITSGEMFIDGTGQGTPAGNIVFRTVWDGGGVDTYDLSSYTTDLVLDLAPGGFSDFDAGGTFQRAVLNDGYGGLTKLAHGHLFNALQFQGDARSLIENAEGGSGDDTLLGNAAANTLWGNAGSDSLTGDAGDDRLSGGDGGDRLIAGKGSDTVEGGAGRDRLVGEDGADTLRGNKGNDRLLDGKGADLLAGGAGLDTFDMAADGTTDTVTDFQDGSDLVRLAGLSFAELTITDLGGGRVRIAHAADRLILEDGAGTLAAADLDAADFLFA